MAENKTRTISRLKMVAGAGPEVIVGGTGSVEGMCGLIGSKLGIV